MKLADYGISRFANPGGVKGEEGTPGYLAPEAIRRRGEDQAFDEKVGIVLRIHVNIYVNVYTHNMYTYQCTHKHTHTGGHFLLCNASV